MEPIIAIVLVLIGYALGSAKLINQGNEALVERLGRYHRKLQPGLNFIVPLLDQIVMEDTTREQVLDIKPQNVITQDGIYLEVDGVVSWKIEDVEKSFYAIDNLEESLKKEVSSQLRGKIGQKDLRDVIASTSKMSEELSSELYRKTKDWGVKIIAVNIESLTPPESVRKSMEEERAAEMRKQAVITTAEGERQAAIKRAEATKQSIQILSEAMNSKPETKEILKYLVAQEQVEASQRLSASNNAKVVFLNPGMSEGAFDQMIGDTVSHEANGNSGNGS
ncbi:MAG: SPFH domain-containing protein [Heteroscytonema crispum UTEX LB 1556]